jgi:hypothetical protein
MNSSMQFEGFEIIDKGGQNYELRPTETKSKNMTTNDERVKLIDGRKGLLQTNVRNYFRNKHASEILWKTKRYKQCKERQQSRAVRSSK